MTWWSSSILDRARSISDRPLDGGDFLCRQAELLADLRLHRLERCRVVLEELFHVLASLAEALAVEGEPGAALFDDLAIDRQVEQVPFPRDPLAIHHVELRLAE